MKILYLHGLNSKLHLDRREVLEIYTSEIHAPSLDYQNDHSILSNFLLSNDKYDIIIGSSAGGLLGFYLANQLQIPSLLFNPAIPFRNQIHNLPNLNKQTTLMQVCLGWQDTIVNPKETLDFFEKEIFDSSEIHINIRKSMAHPLPIDWFSQEVKTFFSKLSF